MKDNNALLNTCSDNSNYIAYQLNVCQETVRRWRVGLKKIPPKYWHQLIQLSNGKINYQQIEKLNTK